MTDDDREGRERLAATHAWTRFVVVITARGLVAMLLGFVCWAVGPTLLGWHATTVVSDSMRPAIATGDVVTARPTNADELRPGQVLLVPDPDHEGRLRLHRYASTDDEGQIITRGDANNRDDSSHVAPDDVLGVGTLRVPFVGQPVVWTQQGRWAPVLVTAVGILGAVALSLWSAAPGAAATADVRGRGDGRGRRRQPRGAAGRSRSRRAGVVVASMTVAMLVALASPVVIAHAAFSATTGEGARLATASTSAPERVSCTTNLNGTVTIAWEHRGDTAGFTVLADGQPRTSLGADARSTVLSVRSLFSWSRQTITVRSELDGPWAAISSSVDVRIFSFLGLGSVRCA